MLFPLFAAAVSVALGGVVASQGTVARHLSAFVPAPGLRHPPWAGFPRNAASDLSSVAGVSTRRASRPFQTHSLPGDVASLLDRSSALLYETFSRGSYASPGECLVASAAYVLPLMDAVENFGEAVKPHVPELAQHALRGIHHLSQFYTSVPFLSYTTSTLIYSGLVKKNQLELSYFLRYHFLQSLILSSFQNSLAMFYFKLLPIDLSSQDFVPVVSLMSAVFASFGAVFYCVFHSLFGRFAALPIISDAVQLHIGEVPANAILTKPAQEDLEEVELPS